MNFYNLILRKRKRTIFEYLKLIYFILLQFKILHSNANIIKIAHLQPNNPNIMHEPHVLQMCANDLKERSILPPEMSLE